MRPYNDAVLAAVERIGGSWSEVSDGATPAERAAAVRFPKRLMDRDAALFMMPSYLNAIDGLPPVEDVKAVIALDLPTAPTTPTLPHGIRWSGDEWQSDELWFEDHFARLDFSIIDEDILADLQEALEVQEVTTVVLLSWSDGYPSYHFVLESDPNPADPQVYSSDHTEFMADIEALGPLSTWLSSKLDDKTLYTHLRELASQ